MGYGSVGAEKTKKGQAGGTSAYPNSLYTGEIAGSVHGTETGGFDRDRRGLVLDPAHKRLVQRPPFITKTYLSRRAA